MPVRTIYTLEESNMTISGSGQLSGISQGNGSHLNGLTITLNNNNWRAVDIEDNDASFQDSSNGQTLISSQSYNGTPFLAGQRVEAEYGLTLQDPDGNTYTVVGFNINEAGVTSYATVEGLAFVGGVGGFPPIGVPLTVIGSFEGPNQTHASLATPPCFTRGSRLLTPSGYCAIEDLALGDLVTTMDHGAQPIRWIGLRRFPAAVLQARAEFRPILVRKDAFGAGLPDKDLRLSPQHRVLIGDWQAQLLFGEDEILVPIKKLSNDRSVIVDHDIEEVEYYHVLLDQHEVMFCEGLPCESLFLADADDQESAVGQELRAIFSEQLDRLKWSHAARPVISDYRTLAFHY